MSEKNGGMETWETTIKLFLSERREKKELDLLTKKDSKKRLDDPRQGVLVQLLHKLSNIKELSGELEGITKMKNSGANKMAPLKFQQTKFMHLLELAKGVCGVDEIKRVYDEKLAEINNFHKPVAWISWAAENAKSVMFATHVAKLTHPSIKQASSFSVRISHTNGKYLDTSSLSKVIFDDAVDNAAYIPVSTFLKLKVKEQTVADCISRNELSPLKWVTEDNNLLGEWVDNFSESFETKNPRGHFLLKQIYFPVKSVNTSPKEKRFEYHLLCNIQSSTLAHNLFKELKTPYEERSKKYQDSTNINFPCKALVAVTASKKAHANVSPLHVKRDGKLYLLSSQPPTWQSQLKPPINKRTIFDRFFPKYAKEEIVYLRDFLLRFARIGLSVKDPEKKKWIEKWVQQIVDEVMLYAVSIQNIPSGWSNRENIVLKPAYQYLLDPYRDDESFCLARRAIDWQKIICSDFASWLNGRLRGKDRQFTPQSEHTKMWKELMENELREHVQALDWEIKQQNREERP